MDAISEMRFTVTVAAWTRRLNGVRFCETASGFQSTIRNLKSKISYSPFAASQRSASSAAMQPLPAAVTAWR